jgi:hypothetical protein
MKRSFLILLLINLSANSYGQWVQLFQFPTGARTIYFLDHIGHPEMGFAGLYDGSIWKTSDGGISWQKEFTDPNGLSISDITFKDNTTGWFCTNINFSKGSGTASVYRTSDGGVTWKLIRGSPGGFYSLYYFQPQKTLYLSDWQSGFSSNDDGNTWNLTINQTYLNGFIFSDAQNGIVTTAKFGGGNIYSTNDGGASWQLFSTLNRSWQAAVKPGTTSFFIFSEYTSTLTRNDGFGIPWQTISTIDSSTYGYQYFTGCLRISSCTGQFYVQSSIENGLYVSSDDGVTWQNIGGPSNEVDSRFWINGNLVFACDVKGALCGYQNPVNPVLSFPSDTLSVFAGNCAPISTTIYLYFDSCSVVFDSIISATFPNASPFRLSEEEKFPRNFSGSDSIKIIYSPTGAKDTALFTLRVVSGGNEIDTVLHFVGNSQLPFTFFAPQLSAIQGTHLISVTAGQDTMLNFSVTQDILASEGLDSISFYLQFDTNMLNLDSAQAPSGWGISLDSVQPGFYLCTFYNASHSDLTANQTLASFFFSSFLALDTLSVIHLIPANVFFDSLIHKGCSIESFSSGDSVIVQVADACSDKMIRNFMSTGDITLRIISIRPNPANSVITIETDAPFPQDVTVVIYGDLGRKYIETKQYLEGKIGFNLSIATLPAGVYHLTLKSLSGNVTSDFVKLH